MVRPWRLLFAALAVAGLGLAGLVLPAAAQTAPPPTIDSTSPRCADSGRVTVSASGTSSWSTVDLAVISPTGAVVGTQQVFADGRWGTGSLAFTVAGPGEYEVRATDRAGRASSFIPVPCSAPTLTYDPPCFAAGYSGSVTMTGRYFRQFEQRHLIEYDLGGSEAQTQVVTADNRGVIRATFSVKPASRAHPGRARDANGGLVATASWNVCTVATTTTSSSTTVPSSTTITTAPPDDTVPDDPGPTTSTTARPADVPGTPSVTIPPTIELPPPTPGATLTVSPELGPAGFVTAVIGTGFPPGPVIVAWSPGIGATTAVVGPDGTFGTRLLVFPNDRLGPRAVVATGGTTTAYDAFLVVQSTVQPSGQDVQQINRIRRFNQRG